MPEIGSVAGPRQQRLEAVRRLGRVEAARRGRAAGPASGCCSSRAAGSRASAAAGSSTPASARFSKASTVFWLSTLRVRRRMDELQVLGDELEVDQPAAHLLQLPEIVACPSPCRCARACRARRRRSWRGRAARSSDVADGRLDARAQRRRPRDDARARQRHVLPGPGLARLVVRRSSRAAWRPVPSGRTGAGACRPRRAMPSAVGAVKALIRRCVRRA